MRPALLALSLLLFAAPADAALRSPQVMVSGTALASFFATQSQSIAVVGDQRDLPEISLFNVGIPGGSFTLFLQAKLGGGTLYAYNTTSPAPPLYELFPGAASPGWFTVASMRYSPERLVVNLFDAQGSLVGTNTYLGADGLHLGLAVGGPSGVGYSEDSRNPEGLARLLFYGGTAAHYGDLWICSEDAVSGRGDFADSIFLIEGIAPAPAQHTTWGALKQRFR